MSEGGCSRGIAVNLPGMRPAAVWALLTDPVRLAALSGADVRLGDRVGAPARALGVDAEILEAVPNRRLSLRFTPAAGSYERKGDTKPATVSFELTLDGTQTELELRCTERSHAAAQAATGCWWKRFLEPLFEALTLPPEPDALPPEPPPSGAAQKALASLLGEPSRDEAAWAVELAARGKKKPRGAWWKLKSPATLGLYAWGAALAALGRPVRVRAALAAAKLAVPVWEGAAKARPPMFDDVAGAMGPGKEAGEPPAAQLAALGAWLACPTRKHAKAALATTDQTRQLRYVDRDLGDLGRARFAYALEASSAAIGAIRDEACAETPIALTCAAEALVEAPAPARGATPSAGEVEAARVAIAVAKALRAWIASSPSAAPVREEAGEAPAKPKRGATAKVDAAASGKAAGTSATEPVERSKPAKAAKPPAVVSKLPGLVRAAKKGDAAAVEALRSALEGAGFGAGATADAARVSEALGALDAAARVKVAVAILWAAFAAELVAANGRRPSAERPRSKLAPAQLAALHSLFRHCDIGWSDPDAISPLVRTIGVPASPEGLAKYLGERLPDPLDVTVEWEGKEASLRAHLDGISKRKALRELPGLCSALVAGREPKAIVELARLVERHYDGPPGIRHGAALGVLVAGGAAMADVLRETAHAHADSGTPRYHTKRGDPTYGTYEVVLTWLAWRALEPRDADALEPRTPIDRHAAAYLLEGEEELPPSLWPIVRDGLEERLAR